MDAQKKLRVLRNKWSGCTKCALAKLRGDAPILFGEGPYNADILVLMDAPTADDVREHGLLSGDSGQLVHDIILQANIKPEDTFRTTLTACRPYTVIPSVDENTPEREQDREPSKEEIGACSPRILEIIYLVDPRIIIAMGDSSWKYLVPSKARGRHNTISSAAGELFETIVPGRIHSVRYPVMAVLSPKNILANPSVAPHGPISTTIEFFVKANQYVSLLKKKEVEP